MAFMVFRFEKAKGIMLHLLVFITLFTVAFTMIYTEFSKYELLPGDDPAYWIKTINEFYTSLIRNHTYPSNYYREILFPLISTFLMIILGDIFLATITTVSLAYAFYGYTSFLIGKKTLKNRSFIFLLTFLAMFPLYPQVTPIDMLGWGGYYQLLALPFMNLEMYFSLGLIFDNKNNAVRNILGLLISVLAVFLTHLPSGFFALLDAAFCILVYLLSADRSRNIIYISLPLFVTPIVVYVFFNKFVLKIVRVSLYGFSPYIYRSLHILNSKILSTLQIIILSLCILLIPFFAKKRTKSQIKNITWTSLLVLLAYFIIPILISYALLFLLRFSTDYNRITYFLWIPTATIFAYSLDALFNYVERRIKFPNLLVRHDILVKNMLKFGVIVLIVANSIVISTTYLKHTISYFSINHDKAALDLINWIKENTNSNEKILAPTEIGRWINTLSGNPILYSGSEYYVSSDFTSEELADLLYTSKFMIRNGFVRVKFYAQGNSLYSPGIQFYYKGAYEEAIWIRDEFLYLNLSYTDGNEKHYYANPISIQPKRKFFLTSNETLGNLTVVYEKVLPYNKMLIQVRQILVKKGIPFVTIKLHLKVINEKIRINLLNFSLLQISGLSVESIYPHNDGQLWYLKMFDGKKLPILVSFNPEPNSTYVNTLNNEPNRYIATSVFRFLNEFKDSVEIEIRIKLDEDTTRVYSPELEDREAIPIIAVNVSRYLLDNPVIDYILIPQKYMRSFWLSPYYWYLRDFFLFDYNFTIFYENEKWILFG